MYGQKKSEVKPNIVFIVADDLGWADLNCFDPLKRDFYETPNLNKLASQGISFTNAYSNAANCSPTRAALISGQYYPRQPIYHVGTPGKGKLIPAPNGKALPSKKITIAESLKKGGYSTAMIGKWHIGESPTTGPLQQGFDLNIGGYNAGNPGNWQGGYFNPNKNPYINDANDDEYLTDYLTRKAIDFIKSKTSNPFFLYMPLYTPHSPFQAPENLVRKYRNKKGDRGHDHATYAAMLENMDTNVGRIMRTLTELGIEDNTIVIFCSDNGGRGGYDFLGHGDNNITSNDPLKGGKGTFYEGGIRVPMIFRWPGKINPGDKSTVPVMTFDIYPTLLEISEIDPPQYYILDGESLMSILTGNKSYLDRTNLFWHFPGYPNNPWRTTPVSVIRSGNWKLMRYYENDQLHLYNLADDPGENQNLAYENSKMTNILSEKLNDWLMNNSAPLPKKP